MKNKKGLIAAIIIGVVLIITGILLIILLPKKSNKELYADALKKSLGLVSDENSIEGLVEKFQEKIEKSNYKLTIDVDVKQAEAGSSKIKEILYFGNKKAYLTSSLSAYDQTMNMEAMLKDDKLYFNLKDILSKKYYIDKIGEMIDASNANDPFMEKFSEYIVDSFLDSINSKEVVTKEEKLTINGTAYNATVYGYTFTGETLSDFVVELANKIKKDNDFYKGLNSFLEKNSGMIEGMDKMSFTKEMLDALMDQLIASADQLKSIGNLASYTVYMNNDDVIGVKAELLVGEKPSTFECYEVIKDEKSYGEIIVSEGNKESFKLVLDEKTKGNGDLLISVNGEEVVKGYVKESNNNYEIKLYGAKNNPEGYILMNINNDYSGTIKIVSDSSGVGNLTLDYKLEKVDTIPEMDITGSVSIEDMTESDKQILEYFSQMISPKKNNISYSYDY